MSSAAATAASGTTTATAKQQHFCPKPAENRKDLSKEMATSYLPKEVEAGWFDWWNDSQFFKPRSDNDDKFDQEKNGKFVIVLPPPNVTGRLHLGHALTSAVQDTIIRFQRMQGRDCLYVPGCDHAGIATQVVVEKRLMSTEGKSRHDLGREKFLERVWEHKNQHSGFISNQLKLLGSSCDWSRDRFTMDDQCAAAVREAFVQLHEQGKVYRATRLVNWCCALQSAISDLEVDFEEMEPKSKTTVPGYDRKVDMGQLTHFSYPVEGDAEGAELVVATTRPETIIGDTAIAVHPEDERYKKFHGKRVKCPFRDATIPIITDPVLVDMSFGTGVVKVTPAHDPNDFECGQRNKLDMMVIFDLKGFVTVEGEFKGMHRFAARWHVVDALKKKNLLKDVEAYANRVPRCQRTRDIVEPMLMPQWFVDCRDMAQKSVKAVETGELKLTPDYHNVTWNHFLKNIKPWCVSRQLWWGHRIPAYQVKLEGEILKGATTSSTTTTAASGTGGGGEGGSNNDNEWIVARNLEEAKQKAQKQYNLTEEQLAKCEFLQDPDVLDTWFSSALWPFSTMGWPNKTSDMERFFPNSLLETGHDILFFWVARMVMMSFHFLGKVPFTEVFLHAMVRDKDGRKMSKSLGNVIDPIDVMHGIALQGLHDKLQGGNLDPKEHERAIKFQKQAFPKGIPDCGNDALRFGLLSYTQSGRNVNLDIDRVVGYRQFCNKLWNLTKYLRDNTIGKQGENAASFVENVYNPETLLNPANKKDLPLECRWLLSRLDSAIEDCTKGMSAGTYDFALATTSVYAFAYYDVCDVFVELTKPVFKNESEAGPERDRKVLTQNVLHYVVEQMLRLLHPMMPFVTEELYHRLPCHKTLPSESVMMASYPTPSGWRDAAGAEEDMETVQKMVSALRSIRGTYTIVNKVQPDCWIVCGDAETRDKFALQSNLVKTLAWMGKIEFILKSEEAAKVPIGCAFGPVVGEIGVHMSIKEFIDPVKEIAKLQKEIDRTSKQKTSLETRMQTADYKKKVGADVQEKDVAKAKQLEIDLQALSAAKTKMEELKAASGK